MNQNTDYDLIEKHIKFYSIVIGLSATLAILLIYGLGSSLFNYFLSDIHYQIINPWAVALSQILLLLLPSVLMVFILKESFQSYFPLKIPSLKFIMLSVIGIIALLAASEAYLNIQEFLIPIGWKKAYIESLNEYKTTISQIVGTGNSIVLLQAIGIVAIVPAIAEEFLFRGFLQRSLMKGTKPITAILITSILFSFSHLNLINAIPLVLIGFYLGYMSYLSASIILPILLHFLNNAISVTSFFLNQSTNSSSIITSKSELNLYLIIFTISISIVIGLVIYMDKLYNQSRENHQSEV